MSTILADGQPAKALKPLSRKRGHINKTPTLIAKIEAAALEINNNPPDKANNHSAIGFITPLQAQFGLPHQHVPGNEWERVNGNTKFRIVSGSGAGIPTGSTPRCGLAWVATWQVKHPLETCIPLGKNLSSWMRDEMQLQVTGGKNGTITKLKQELFKLFSASISVMKTDPEGRGISYTSTGSLAKRMELWDAATHPSQDALFASFIVLNTDFRELLLEHPIPVDLRAFPALRKSPLAIDYYCWLAYRFSYLRTPTLVTWEQLHAQFGSNYDWSDKRGRWKFRTESAAALTGRVLKVYPQARVQIMKDGTGLMLHPSLTPVPMTTRKLFLPM
jgi:hypothetical protein